MPATASSFYEVLLPTLLLVAGAYFGGRIHQWYRHNMDRDDAFREGYNHAYHALFSLAARSVPAGARPARALDGPPAAQEAGSAIGSSLRPAPPPGMAIEEKCDTTRSSVGSSSCVQCTARCRYSVSR